MKKHWVKILAFCLVAMMILSSCNSGSTATEDTTDLQTEATESETTAEETSEDTDAEESSVEESTEDLAEKWNKPRKVN